MRTEREGDSAGSRRLGPGDAAAFAGLIAAVFLLYGRALRFWWTFDDLVTLKVALLHRPFQYFFDPTIYREVSELFFFPGLVLSFDVDVSLFGPRPFFFFLHQLGSLAAAGALLFFLLRRWQARPVALAGAFLALAGPPIAGMVPQLMTRHYVEGLCFLLLAALCLARSLRRFSAPATVAAILFSCLAMACKEIYPPLVLLLPLIPEGSPRSRLRHGAGFAAVVTIYFVWRQGMLRGYLGGYSGETNDLTGLPGVVWQLVRAAAGVVGRNMPLMVLLLVAGFLAVPPLVERPRRVIWIALASAAIGAPLVPLAGHPDQARFAFLAWIAIAFAVSCVAEWWRRRGGHGRTVSALLLMVCGVLSLVGNRRLWVENVARARRSRAEGLFVVESSRAGDALRRPVEISYYFGGLEWLRTVLGRTEPCGRAVYDDVFLCQTPPLFQRVFGYDASTGRVEELGRSLPPICAEVRKRMHPNAPLHLAVRYQDTLLRWEAGPYTKGQWAFLGEEGTWRVDVERGGSLRVALPAATPFVLRYESPEGWLTYSPQLMFHIADGRGELDFRR